MAALVQRNATGQGATLDIAMYDALFSMLTTSHAQHFYGGVLPGRVGNRHPLSTPFGCFKTSDGQVVIAVLNGGQFQRLAVLIGKPEIADDPRFASDSSRTEHEPVLRALIEAWSGSLTTEQAVSALTADGLPTAPIWDIAQAANNDHAASRGLVGALRHPVLGQAPVVGQPVRFDGVKPLAATAAPSLGGDLEAMLKEFGLEDRA
jgi:CoA:oxalate CoA-transferase